MKPGLWIIGGLCVVAVLIVGIAGARYFRDAPATSETLLEEARLVLARGDHQRAEALANQAAATNQASPWARLVAAEAALKTNRYADALKYYQQTPRQLPAVADSADFGEAEMLCHLGRLSESESQLRKLLARQPQHTSVHFRLAFLLNITGRRWEAQPHVLHVIQNLSTNVEQLLLLGNAQRQIEERALLEATEKQYPDDPLPKLGSARLALTLNKLDDARSLLKDVLRQLPNEPEAVVRWGQLLLEDADPQPFIIWSSNLKPEVERHPDVWMLRGQFAQRSNQQQIAARCFWEALRRNPEHQAACHQLGRTLVELNDAERAAPFLERAEQLQRLTAALDDLFHHRTHVESMRRAAVLAIQMGRFWEAAHWASAAASIEADLPWVEQIQQQIVPQLRANQPQTDPAFDLSQTFDLSMFPLPAWTPISVSPRKFDVAEGPSAVIRFTEHTQQLGIDFQYENAADESTVGARIFETTGGGVGVIDYDLDGWPDLYLTQGNRDPGSSINVEFTDRLFRNLAGDRFVDVTEPSRLGDRAFSQGVTVGDFNNDGFPDLYVANLGKNRLYRNQGDGTFTDMTAEAGIVTALWTTSCLMADLNGDGFADLYDVNYAAGDSVLTRICEKQGVLRSCSPRAFDPAPDQLWLSQGDGNIRDASVDSGIDAPSGYGLGIVAFDLEGSGRLSLFVANDEVPNFLFVNQMTSKDQTLRYHEQALIAGAALDADGKSQACMGVAAGDSNGDGLIDLFVTNFYLESNTLYRQIIPSQFADVTRTTGLRDPSFPMLGFGTQFLDADLDGWEDLIVTNGHIDDLTAIGEPYRMPTQFFRNVDHGRFTEVPATSLGSFFQRDHLGRGLARLDWNRDGKEDFAVSHLREPFALLTNESPTSHHYLAVQLSGTTSSRDAIGATVEIQIGERRILKQLTAGDGYHASNERLIRFGLGATTLVDKLTVRWPDGRTKAWDAVATDQQLLLIEGAARYWPMPR